MDVALRKKVFETIFDLWPDDNSGVGSADVHERLTSNGEQIAPGAMNEILQDLLTGGNIQGEAYFDSDAVKKHGAVKITGVNPRTLELWRRRQRT